MSVLHTAIDHSRFKQFTLLLGRGVDVNQRDEKGLTPILKCAFFPEKRAARWIHLLIQKGADPTLTDTTGLNVLSYAVKLGKEFLVKSLLEEDCVDVNFRDREGNTVLHLAAYNGSVRIMKCILNNMVKYRMSPDLPNQEGFTPLMIACARGYLDIARLLVQDAKASLTVRDNKYFMNAREWLESAMEIPEGSDPFRNPFDERDPRDGRTCPSGSPMIYETYDNNYNNYRSNIATPDIVKERPFSPSFTINPVRRPAKRSAPLLQRGHKAGRSPSSPVVSSRGPNGRSATPEKWALPRLVHPPRSAQSHSTSPHDNTHIRTEPSHDKKKAKKRPANTVQQLPSYRDELQRLYGIFQTQLTNSYRVPAVPVVPEPEADDSDDDGDSLGVASRTSSASLAFSVLSARSRPKSVLESVVQLKSPKPGAKSNSPVTVWRRRGGHGSASSRGSPDSTSPSPPPRSPSSKDRLKGLTGKLKIGSGEGKKSLSSMLLAGAKNQS